MKTTEADLQQTDAATYTALRDAYYKTSDGLVALQEAQLKPEERLALNELKAAFAKLSHLGKIL